MAIGINGSVEENVLTALCWHSDTAVQLMTIVKAEMFTEPYRPMARRIMGYISKYGASPCGHVRDLFELEMRRGDEVSLLFRRTFDAMEQFQSQLQPDYVLDRLDVFLNRAQLQAAIDDAQRALDEEDIETAKIALTREEVRPEFDNGIWLHKPDEMLAFLNEDEGDIFTTGIDELDKQGVFMKRATESVLIAAPKQGKSWYLINQVKKNLMRGKNVLHITCENSEKITAQRYVQCLYAMSRRQLQDVELPFFERLEDGGVTMRLDRLASNPIVLNESQKPNLTKKLKAFEPRAKLLIKHFPSGMLTVPQINAYLNALEMVKGYKPDLLIVDYPKQMKLDSKNYRLDLGRIMIELRGIAVARNIAVSTVMQGGRQAKNAKMVTSTMVSEDYSMVGTADLILTFSRTREEKKIGLARIFVDSARDATDSFVVMISQHYDTGQFCLDSVMMSQSLETEADQYTGASKGDDDDEEDN